MKSAYVLGIATLAACTTHHRLDRTPVYAGADVSLRVAGQPVAARSVQAGAGISYQDRATGRVYTLAEVDQLVVKSRLKGGLQGLGLGALVGGAVGAVIGYASGDDSECSGEDSIACGFNFGRGPTALLVGFAGGAFGGLIGLAVGVARGATDIYDRPKPAVTAGGPAGSVAGVTVSF